MIKRTKASSSQIFNLWLILILFGIPVGLLGQTIGITGDNTINKCETKQYTISIQNNSGNPLTDLVITGKIGNLVGFSYYYNSPLNVCTIDVNGTPICNGGGDNSEPVISGTDLIWNIDTRCPNDAPFTLNNGETLNISFWLQTSCSAVSGSLNVRFDYEISGTPTFDETGAHSIQVNPGGVTIKKTPNVVSRELGQNVTWTLTIENTGLGTIENVEVTDVLGAGLQYVSSDHSNTVSGGPGGETIFWDSGDVVEFASMDPGDIVEITIEAQVIDCEYLENTADVRWGCNPGPLNTCFNTATDGGTATASIQRIVKTPLISYTAPDVNFSYCADYVDINMTISNIGDGTAYDVWTIIDFGGLTVSNVSAGAAYNTSVAPPLGPRFELTNPIAPLGSYNLSFRLNYSAWCGGGFPVGDLLWQKVYKDACDNEFYPPVELSQVNAPTGNTGLSVSKSSGQEAMQIGDQITYSVQSSYSGDVTCGSGSVGQVTVIDTVPDGFTVIDDGLGSWVPGGGGTGGTITWYYTPPGSLNDTVILQAPSMTECETYCNSTFTNTISASVVDCCGCTLNASDSETVAIECEEGVDSNKTANPGTGERCGQIEYTNTYRFDDVAGNDLINVTDLTFTEGAEYEQAYANGSLSVTIEDLSGGGAVDITACATSGLIDTTPGGGGNLQINFSNCTGYGTVRNKEIIIRYRLNITTDTVAACAGRTFYSWSSLYMGATGSQCLADGTIYEASQVTIEPPAMSVGISGLSAIIHKCEDQNITITLTQTSANSNPKDVRLVLSGLNYYVVDPGAVGGSGVMPTSGNRVPTVISGGDSYVWEFGDGFSAATPTATITLAVRKRCSPGGALEAIAYYDDLCNDDANYDDTCQTSGSDTPALLLSGDLLIEKTPEVYYSTTNTVEWTIYVTNRGTGTAYNVWVDDILGSGLTYSNAIVDGGVWSVTANQDHDGAPSNGATISIEQIPAGIRRQITFTATYSSCSNLTNIVRTSWGCINEDCQSVVEDNSTVTIAAPLVVNTNTVTTPVDACASPQGYITIKNSGQITAYNFDIQETFPAGLLYVANSTRWRLYTGGAWGSWNGPSAGLYNPNPAISPIRWTKNEIPGLATLQPGERIEIEFDCIADCPFLGGDVILATSYENPCGQVFTNADSTFTVAFRDPDVTITKTPNNTILDCNEDVTWTINVTNNSTYLLPVLWLEDTLGAAYTYQSSTGDPMYTNDNGTNVGNVVTWEIKDLVVGGTASVTITGRTDSIPCASDMDNTVRAWWGCGAVDGLSTTKPGEPGADSDKCLTTSEPLEQTNTPTRQPATDFLGTIGLNPVSIDSCNQSSILTVKISNTGRTDASDVDLVITLPAGLSFNTGSANMCQGVDDTCSPVGIADPAISGNQLIFRDINDKGNDLVNTLDAAGGNDTIVLTFSVRSECYVTADVDFDLYFYDCCSGVQYQVEESVELGALYPQLSVTKTPVNSQVDCSDPQTWTITVTNNGTGTAQVVQVIDTPGSWINVDTGASPGIYDAGDGRYGWEANNLGAGSSTSFTLVGTLDPAGFPNQADCTLALRQNNVTVDWGCGTAGDTQDGNPFTESSYDCSNNDPASAPVATLRMPNLIVDAITPSFTCTSDGVFTGSVTVRVRNTGNGVSSGSFTVSINDGKGWSSSGTYSGAGIAASGTANVVISGWTPTCQSCASPFSFVAVVDAGTQICECNEGDNSNSASPVSYSMNTPDLQVTADTLAVSCNSDGRVTVSGNVTVRNNGCVSAYTTNTPIRITLYDNTGCDSGSGSVVGFFDTTLTGVNIAANGGTQSLSVSGNIDGSICGHNQVSVKVDLDPNATICECLGTNNSYCSGAKNVNIPDIEVTDDNLTVQCNDDGVVRVGGTIEITNSGQGSALSTSVPLRFTLYSDSNCDSGSGSALHTWTDAITVNVAAGASVSYSIANHDYTANLVSLASGCNVSIKVEADYTASICECDGTNNDFCTNKAINIPDLEVGAENLAFNCDSDGSIEVTGSVTLRNNGCGSNFTGNVPVRFELYSGGSCSGSAFYSWDETLSADIASGGGTDLISISDHIISRNLCNDATSCQFSVRVTVDPDDSVCESDGTDNVMTCSSKTLNVPDLVINSVTPAVSCSVDGTLTGTVTVNVSNNGCGSASNAPLQLTSSCAGYTFTNQSVTLAAGANTDVVFNYTPTCSDCLCNFTATIDPGAVVCECDDTNNAMTSSNFTPNIQDMEVSTATLTVTCNNDGEVTVGGDITVRNNGCGVAFTTDIPVRLTLYNATGCDSGSGTVVGTWTETLSSVSINSGGGTQVFNISENITGNLCANSQVSVKIELDPANPTDTICECDGTNNEYCVDDIDIAIPDIEVTGDNLTVSCLTDGNVRVAGTLAITNNGVGANITGDIPVRFTMYNAAGCTTGSGTTIHTWTGTLTGVDIAPGATENISISSEDIAINLVDNSTNCQVSIRVEVDYDTPDSICECNGNNNGYCTDKGVDIPDIEVVSDTLAFTCTDDGQFEVSGTVTIRNHGCGTTLNANIPVQFTLYGNTGCNTGAGSQISQWNQNFTGVSIPTSAGSNTQTFTITSYTLPVNICSSSTGWNVSLRIEADYTAIICESDGTDNELCSDKTVTIPDLTVSNVASGITCQGDGSLTGTTVTVNNTGNANATGVVVRLQSDCGLTFTDQTIDVPAGESRDVFFAFTSGIVNCTCNFSATVDPDNTICECDGTNNSGTSTTAMLIPDLEMQAANLNVICINDGIAQVSGTFTLINNGCGPIFTDSIPIRFTLYGEHNAGGTQVDQWAITLTGVNLDSAGGTQTFTIPLHQSTYNFCSLANAGQLSVRMEIDHTGTICEWDGTDNTFTTNINSQFVDLEATGITATADCQSDGVYTSRLVVSVRNNGNSALTDDFYIQVDDGRGWSAELRYHADLHGTLPLPAGASATVNFDWSREFATGDCDFTHISAVVDSRNQVCQCSTDNDTIATSLQQPTPNLKPTVIEPSCSADGTYSIRVTIENDGCGNAGSFTVHLQDNLGHSADLVVEPGVAAHQTTTLEFRGWPATCEPKNVIFTASVDSNADVCEIHGPDNQVIYNFSNPSPDLVFTEVKPAATCTSLGEIQGMISLTMQNNGNAAVTQDFKVIVNDGKGWSMEKFYQAELGGILPIEPGSKTSVRVNWNRDFTKEPFTCDFNNIGVEIDPATAVCECASNNNQTVTTYRIPYPDVSLEKLEAECEEDGKWRIRLTVSNNGCDDLSDNFQLRFSDSTGESRTVSFTSIGGVLPLRSGSTQVLTLNEWPIRSSNKTLNLTVDIISEGVNTGFCDLNPGNNTINSTMILESPELYLGEITWECKEGGNLTFTFVVGNNGSVDAVGVPVTVYAGSGIIVFSTTVNLPAGASQQLTFTVGPYPANETVDFRFVIDESNQVCELGSGDNEKIVPVIPDCTGSGELKIAKFCPVGQEPGGLFRFEIQLENPGDSTLYNVMVEDFLPVGFQYVPGSSSLGGSSLADPGIKEWLTWNIGSLEPGAIVTLVFSATADADIDPGRYCNEARAHANSGSLSGVVINSNRVECCTIVTGQTGDGCCLDIEEWPLSPYRKPEGPVSFIEPYFHTESAMFTVYAALTLWKDSDLEKGKMPRFMKERLQNYARSTVEEFYFNSRLGLSMPDGTIWLSHAGAYPEKEEIEDNNNTSSANNNDLSKWVHKQLDETMTVSQVGFELMALNAVANVEEGAVIKNKIKEIIVRKLSFLAFYQDELPHGWELQLGDGENENSNNELTVEDAVKLAVKHNVKKSAGSATLYDRVVLYLALVELKNAGYGEAGPLAARLRESLASIDNDHLDRTNPREELMFMLALLKNNESGRAQAKLKELDAIYNTSGENSDNNDKQLLDNLHDYGLAIYLSRKIGGTLHEKLLKALKDKYYMEDTGILAEKQPDFTFKLNLYHFAPVIMAFDTENLEEQEQYASVLYRTFDEVGLFLKKRNLSVGKPLYSILKNYPFAAPLLPVLNFTKANRSIAPVFSRDAVVHSTQVKPLGEILIPGSFTKILSPSYETGTGRIARVSFGLQYVGRLFKQQDLRVIKEEGRSMDDAGLKYIDALLYSGAGVMVNGNLLLPFDTLAIKGPKIEEFNLEPLQSGTRFSTSALADYLAAEKLYIAGNGKYADKVKELIKHQERIVAEFATNGYVPHTFDFFMDEESGTITIIPSGQKAKKTTIARLLYSFSETPLGKFLLKQLKEAEAELDTDDMIFLAAAPGLVPYFEKELKEMVAHKDSEVSFSAAEVIGRRLLGEDQAALEKSMENLEKHWDKESVMMKSDRIETIEKGLIYHHEPQQFLLYLLASRREGDFKFKRTLNFFTYLLENEWGLEWDKSFITLPSLEYRVFKEEPKQQLEPGDLLTFRVRIDNTCPEGIGSAHDLSSLFIKAVFSPQLIYGGTERVNGLDGLGDFKWHFSGLVEGEKLEFFYQAFVPFEFQYDYISGWIYAGSRQGMEDFGPASGLGDKCEDIDHVKRLNFIPFSPLQGLVFEDRNVNGIKDVGETGVPNILLKDTRGRFFRTDAEGRFTVLAGIEHEAVQIELKALPAYYLLPSEPTRLVNRNYTGDIHFGLVPCKTLKGFVYVDENGNNTFDNGEKRPGGVIIKAKDKESVSGKNGGFIFRNLPTLWQQWLEIKKEQYFYKDALENLKLQLENQE